MRLDLYNYVQLTELDLSDSIGGILSASEVHKMFSILKGPLRLYDFPDNTHMAITFELSRDL